MVGQKNNAIKILNRLEQLSKEKYVSPFYIGAIYLGLDNRDEGFEYYEKAFQEKEPQLAFLNILPAADDLLSDHRFIELIKKIGLEPLSDKQSLTTKYSKN